MESIECLNLNHPESQFDVSRQTSANANANSTECKDAVLTGSLLATLLNLAAELNPPGAGSQFGLCQEHLAPPVSGQAVHGLVRHLVKNGAFHLSQNWEPRMTSQSMGQRSSHLSGKTGRLLARF